MLTNESVLSIDRPRSRYWYDVYCYCNTRTVVNMCNCNSLDISIGYGFSLRIVSLKQRHSDVNGRLEPGLNGGVLEVSQQLCTKHWNGRWCGPVVSRYVVRAACGAYGNLIEY